MFPDAMNIWTVLAVTSDVSVALLVFAGVVVTAVGTGLVARRTHSGQIRDSEAAKLWDESTAMRQELREQVEALQNEIRELKVENERRRARIDELEERIAQLRARVQELESRHG